ncbi:MAG: NCS2 family permease [Sulfolobales archaeon]
MVRRSRILTPIEISTQSSREIIAGITTFLTMAYIIFVNPLIIGEGFELALKNALGVENLSPDQIALVNSIKIGIATATIIAASFGSILMALYARLPFAMAPGMGENSFIGFSVIPAFTVILARSGFSGDTAALTALYAAIFAVFMDGIIFLFAAWSGIRERVLRSISPNLAYGISAGIGLFITFIGLSLAGFVQPGVGTPVSFNVKAFTDPRSLIAFIGLIIASILYIKRFSPAFLLTISILTIIGVIIGVVQIPEKIFELPSFTTSIVPVFPTAFKAYVELILLAFPITFSLFLVEFFDGIGTIIGLATKAGLIDERGRPVNIDRALYTDATATVVGALAGTTTTVIYVESASGIEAGGRTGLTSLVTGVLFLLFLPIAPLAVSIPGFATAPVLILVGLMFLNVLRKIDLEDLTEAIPSFIAVVAIPLTYSIATGIGLAFITYTLLKILSGRFRDIKPATMVITLVFILYFMMLPMIH